MNKIPICDKNSLERSLVCSKAGHRMLVSAKGISLSLFAFLRSSLKRQYLSHKYKKYKAKMQQMRIYAVLRNKALPTLLALRCRVSSYVIVTLVLFFSIYKY